MSTTINSYSVALGLNADGLIDGSKLARGEAASLNRTFQSLVTPSERLQSSLNKLDNALRKGAISPQAHGEAVMRLSQKYTTLNTEITKVHNQQQRGGVVATGMNGLSSRLTNLAAGYIGVHAAANFASGAIRKSADIERASAAYEVLTGSAEEAKDIISGVRDLAGRGISLTALNQSAQTMLSFNIASQSVVPALRQIAEITGGDAERMQRLSLAFSQVASNGRLMGEEVNQMVEAGFNPLQEISRTTGISISDLRKQMADGKISFEMVRDALESVTAEGGRFNGMLEKVEGTTAGAINSAKATFESFQVSVGDALGPAIQAVAKDFKDSAASGGELVGIVRELTEVFVGLNDSIKGVSGKGVLGTVGSGLGFAQALGSQVRSTLTDSLSVGGNLLTGDLQGAIKKTWDVLTPTDDIDEFLDKQNAAQQQAARAAGTMQESMMGQTQTTAAELDPAKVAATYDRLQASIKGAQAAVIPTLDHLREQVTYQQRLSELAEERQDLEREADRIKEQSIEPAAKLADQFSRLDRMLELGINGITADMVAQEKSKLLTDSVKDIKIEAPKNLEVGSQEAYKFFAEQANREQEKAIRAEARANTEKLVTATKEVRTAVDNLAGNIKRKR